MKKIFALLLVLFIVYMGIQVGFNLFGTGHNSSYIINNGDNKFIINENFVNKKGNNLSSYYFQIKIGEDQFDYQTMYDLGNVSNVIKKVYYFKNNSYKCILPIFVGNKIISDIICKYGDQIYNYHDLIGMDMELDKFANSLAENGYNVQNWIDSSNGNIDNKKNNFLTYKDNMIKDKYVGLTNYKGIYLVNNSIGGNGKNIELFNNDVYTKSIHYLYKNYYLVADYNNQYRFNMFYLINIVNGKSKEIVSQSEISFDSYVMGAANDSIYIFDNDNKKQYEINIKNSTILEVGNAKTGVKIYQKGDWNYQPISSAKNNVIKFDNLYLSDIEDNKFVKIDKYGDKVGYYYFYKKNNNNYSVYRANIQKSDEKTYLFDTVDIDRIVYDNDYIYFINNKCINYYNDKSGVKRIICYNELEFNNNLLFSVY